MSKPLRVALWTFLGSAAFLRIFTVQDWLIVLIGGLLCAAIGAVLALPKPSAIQAGLLTGLVGVVFVLTYGTGKPGIALVGGLVGGLGAGLLASQSEHRDTYASGALQGLVAGLIAGAFTALATIIVWLFVAQAAGITSLAYAKELLETVPMASALGLTSDVMTISLLIGLTLLAAGLMGAFVGAVRTVQGPRSNLLVFVAVGIIVVLLPFISNVANLQLLNALIPIYVFILLALGLNIVVGYAGLLDLGYAAFFAIGAYTAGMLSSPHLGIQWNFWIVIWIAAGVAAIAGLILGAPTLPLRGDYLAIVTLGFGEIVPAAFRNLGGGGSGTVTLKFLNFTILDKVDLTGGPAGINPISPPSLPFIGAFTPARQIPWYFLIVGIMVLTIFLINRLRGSRQGRAWTALREDELAADAMGINIVRTKLMAFAMGATFSGFAGAFYGAYISAIFPTAFDFSVSIVVLCMVILGGLGNMAGVIVGGLLIMCSDRIFLPEASRLIRDIVETKTGSSDIPAFRDPTQLRLLLFGMVLVVMMIVRPEGLLPNARRRAELRADEDVVEQANAELFDAERDPQLAGR